MKRNVAFAILGAAAVMNLLAGVYLAWTRPSRASDLLTMYGWCRAWLAGRQIYSVATGVDYPPNAIVVFSAGAGLGYRFFVVLWASLSLIALPALAVEAVRAIEPRASRSTTAVVVLLFLTWGAARTLLQFTSVSLALAVAAVLVADRRPTAGGLLLGLALAKPHVAGPVALWAIAARRARVVLVAMALVVAAFAIYCVHAGAQPQHVLASYARILIDQYGGRDGLVGVTSIRAWTRWLAADTDVGDMVWGSASLLLFAVACAVAIAERGAAETPRPSAAIALFCAWSLLVFYHQGNNVILLLPSFVWIVAAAESGGAPHARAAAALVQIAMMGDVFVRRVDRWIVAFVFAYITVCAWRSVRRASESRREAELKDPALVRAL